jgi:Protein of unknown function (DUF5672)
MLNLFDVTLLCVETREPELAHWAIDRCVSDTKFAKILLITNLDRVKAKRANIDYVQAPPINTTKDYSELLLTGLAQYVEGTHALVIQWDSFVIHPELWSDEFLTYDYIGSVWPHHPNTPVGNGGFSLRSVKLLNALKSPEIIRTHPEDYCICVVNKDFLEKKCGMRIATPEVAERFAVERSEWHLAFGFHGFFNFGRVLNDADLENFLKLLPKSMLSGVDCYDLISYLRNVGRLRLARILAENVQFKWKMRRQYIKVKYWLHDHSKNENN